MSGKVPNHDGIARNHTSKSWTALGHILIVDQPTAALDARAELEAVENILALAGTGRTVVLITHRLASVRHVDLVHVLEQGHLVESGTPDELLASGGVYAELYSLQAEQFTAPVPKAV